MNGTRVATAQMPWRIPSLRIEGFPWIPVIIIGVIALAPAGLLAALHAPHPPDRGVRRALFRPPAGRAGGASDHPPGPAPGGRGVLPRPISGARVPMVGGFPAVIVAGIIGTGLGILS